MAQASKRAAAAPREPQLRPVMYDDDESSSMSLELFGYHGVVVDGDHDVDAGAALPGGLQLAFDDNFKSGGCGPADYYSWTGKGSGGSGASSSSSVLSFELAYSTAGGDDDCAMWMDAAAAGMVDHPGACNLGFVSPGGSADHHHADREIQELGSVQPQAKTAQKRAHPVITSAYIFCLKMHTWNGYDCKDCIKVT
jgi:hypothetical protein